jgi:hypothetical protein
MLKFLLTISFIIVAYVASSSVFCDGPKIWPFCFQDPASPIWEGIIKLNHIRLLLLIFIAIFVLKRIFNTLKRLSILYYREFRAITSGFHITFISSCLFVLIYSLCLDVVWCQGGTESAPVSDSLAAIDSLEGDQLDKAILSAQVDLYFAERCRVIQAEFEAKTSQTIEDDPLFHLYEDPLDLYNKTKLLIKFFLYFVIAVIFVGVLYYIILLYYASLKKALIIKIESNK